MVRDFSFVDIKNGWVLFEVDLEDAADLPYPAYPSGHHRIELWHTADSGRTWNRQPLPPALAEPYFVKSEPPATRVLFATPSIGWLMGHDTHSTRDRGRTWQRAGIPGTVESISIADETAWAVSVLPEKKTVHPQKVEFFQSPITRSDWKCLEPQPRDGVAWGWLFRLNSKQAWFAGYGGIVAPEVLVETTDGGRTWRDTQAPCAPLYDEGLWPTKFFAVPGQPRSVWAVCGGEGADGPYALSVSLDAGARWRLGTVQRPMRTPYWWSPASGTRMWSSGGRGAGWSDDLGVTWTTPETFSEVDVSLGSFGKIQFVDALHGWLEYSGRGLDPEESGFDMIFRTEDGGRTWTGTKLSAWDWPWLATDRAPTKNR